MKGKVTTQYTFWCFRESPDTGHDCSCWRQFDGSRAEATREARSMGWRNTRKHGWLCPGCVREVSGAHIGDVSSHYARHKNCSEKSSH